MENIYDSDQGRIWFSCDEKSIGREADIPPIATQSGDTYFSLYSGVSFTGGNRKNIKGSWLVYSLGNSKRKTEDPSDRNSGITYRQRHNTEDS